MKFIYYIKYFFYIALNWNLRLAFFSIYHEIKGEKKYQINTSRLNDLKELSLTGDNYLFAEIYQGASYYLLEKIFTYLKKLNSPTDIIDLGCGKGRVLVVAAHYGFKKITGIDFARQLCLEAEKNCQVISSLFPTIKWNVLNANAIDIKFGKDDHVFFLFNPFKEPVMTQVIGNILESLRINSRKIFVVYINPQHKKLFYNAGFKEVFYIKRMEYVDACIFEK